MGLFGGGNSTTQANTTNYNTSTTTTRDIGLTGQNAVDVIQAMLGSNVAINQQNTDFFTNSLSGFFQTVRENNQGGYDFAGNAIRDTLSFADRTTARSAEQLANLTNATRDYVQRQLNTSSGQATPLNSIPAATSTVPVLTGSAGTGESKNGGMVLALVAVAAVIFLNG